MYNGLETTLGSLSKLSDAKSRSISPENLTGNPGEGGMCELENGFAKESARDLGIGWKVNPFIIVNSGDTFTLADIEGPGVIQHIWMTLTGKWRNYIIRFYWDDATQPSVEVPAGDFFCAAFQEYHQINSIPVCVNPRSGLNCYWSMPFKKRCRITLENRSAEQMKIYYQIDYALTNVPDDCAYFHAQFRRVNPLPYKEVYTILDGVKGKGHFVGTYMAWGVNNNGWWGEGEIKFYIDNDEQFPTICGTGTEDYFCGSYNFEDNRNGKYASFSSPYTGFYTADADDQYHVQKRFGMYRFHITDPIRFESKLKVTIQALGWRSGRRFMPLQDDIASVAFWYQQTPAEQFPLLPDNDYLEIR